MLRLLPFILVPILVVAGLGYWRFIAQKPLTTSQTTQEEGPIEVPKTLPQVTPSPSPSPSQSPSPTNSPALELNSLDAQVTELKARISALENTTPVPVSSGAKSTVYIPLGSGGKWGDKDWYTTQEYEVSLDPANYPGYTGMVLEVTFRIGESVGTGSVRLYNVTDNSAISSQLDTTSTSFSLKTSSPFTLPSGTKTYKLQVKSTQERDLYIQSARIKVNF